MPENDQLLKAVLDDPGADGPRRAYAAWCSSQREPDVRARGDFIQTQLQLAALPEGGPPDLRNDLQYKQKGLLGAYAAIWAREIGAIADLYYFHRGFVTLATLSARQFLGVAPRLFALAPIRHLNLTAAATVATELFDSPYLVPIRSLSLDGCGLHDADMQVLAASWCVPTLRWLSVADNHLGFDGWEFLAASELGRRLIYVNFTGNPANPGDQYSLDDGNIVGAWQPQEGKSLERRHGRRAWLHAAGDSIWNLVPDRFLLRE